MDRGAALAVSKAATTTVSGRFERHVSPKYRALTGSRAGGRWGPPNSYPVLYLGRPRDSVVAEAFRHLVEPIEGMRPEMVGPRRLIVCQVTVTNVLDLRMAENRQAVNLTMTELASGVGDYAPCHRIGQAAHQLGLHGVIAPAATGLGETFAVFEKHLPADEQPSVVEEISWESLPSDPRQIESEATAQQR